jgi:hypothetical protein
MKSLTMLAGPDGLGFNPSCLMIFCPQGLPILPSNGWFGPAIWLQQNAKRIQWILLAGPKSNGIWYIRLGDQMPSTTPRGVVIVPLLSNHLFIEFLI